MPGTRADGVKTPAQQANLVNYTNAGGRMFATHYSYAWLYNDPPFEQDGQLDRHDISCRKRRRPG